MVLQGGPLGNLVRNARGIITVSLSPFEQRAFNGFFSSVCHQAQSEAALMSLLAACARSFCLDALC
jgi:hypothetical protein